LHIGFFDALLGSVGMIVARIRDAIADTRNIARGLPPVALESNGLMVALQELAENSAKLFLITLGVTEE
jgi:signal transduction histidine kinase